MMINVCFCLCVYEVLIVSQWEMKMHVCTCLCALIKKYIM